MKPSSHLIRYSTELQLALLSVSHTEIDRAVAVLSLVRRPVYVCGNGGSAAISQHFACDHAKGVYQDCGNKQNTNFISLSTNASLLTAIGNDIGFDEVFAHQLDFIPTDGGVLVAISSSGQSPNIIKAIERAKQRGMFTIAMTGFTGGLAKEKADLCLHVDSHNYGIVEDCHQILMHVMAQSIRMRYTSKPLETLRL